MPAYQLVERQCRFAGRYVVSVGQITNSPLLARIERMQSLLDEAVGARHVCVGQILFTARQAVFIARKQHETTIYSGRQLDSQFIQGLAFRQVVRVGCVMHEQIELKRLLGDDQQFVGPSKKDYVTVDRQKMDGAAAQNEIDQLHHHDAGAARRQ